VRKARGKKGTSVENDNILMMVMGRRRFEDRRDLMMVLSRPCFLSSHMHFLSLFSLFLLKVFFFNKGVSRVKKGLGNGRCHSRHNGTKVFVGPTRGGRFWAEMDLICVFGGLGWFPDFKGPLAW
jgi:hypothetical protein